MGCQLHLGSTRDGKERVGDTLCSRPRVNQCYRLLNLTVLKSEQQALIVFPAGTLET